MMIFLSFFGVLPRLCQIGLVLRVSFVLFAVSKKSLHYFSMNFIHRRIRSDEVYLEMKAIIHLRLSVTVLFSFDDTSISRHSYFVNRFWGIFYFSDICTNKCTILAMLIVQYALAPITIS